MKSFVYGLAIFVSCAVAAAAPPLENEIELRTSINLAADRGIDASSMFNPRLFDGDIYANQINIPAFGRYPSKSAVPEQLVFSTSEHRMVAPFRGNNRTVYMLGSSGAPTTVFSRYDFTGENRVDANVPGGDQTSEGFDWVDENTIIYTTYNPSANRKRLSLARVVAEPFSVAADTRWNANGFITTSVSARIRNVRVGDVYSGYAYYGDNGQDINPQFFAIDLATGIETPLGNGGALTRGGVYGIWTVVERGGYLYVQTTDDGIQIYNMTSATTLGPLYATYSKARLDELTGVSSQYLGFDASPDGNQMLLGGAQGIVYELTVLPLRLISTFNLASDAGIGGSSIFNPRIYDGDVYVNQINTPGFGRYALGSPTPEIVIPGPPEHRMVAPFRGANKEAYIFGASGAATTTFARYDFTGVNRIEVDVPGEAQTSEGFDWVDDNTIIYTIYSPSANRKRLALAHVTAEPFSVLPDTRWNADGYVTTSVSTRIRNVRVGDVYSGFAYYGDNGQNSSPIFYAINLATGAETLLGNAGPLTGAGSFGLWTVVERGGRLYVQTTDNGIHVYRMNSATSLGELETTYTKQDLDEPTGYTGQYWGFDVTKDGKTFVLGGAPGLAWELAVTAEDELRLEISRSGNQLVLAWPGSIAGAVIQGAATVEPLSFEELIPRPAVTLNEGRHTASLPLGSGNMFFRLRK